MRHQIYIERKRNSFGSIEIGHDARKTLELVGFTRVTIDAQFIDTAELSFEDGPVPDYETLDAALEMRGLRRV